MADRKSKAGGSPKDPTERKGSSPPRGRPPVAGGQFGRDEYYRRNGARYTRPYPLEMRLKVVKLYFGRRYALFSGVEGNGRTDRYDPLLA